MRGREARHARRMGPRRRGEVAVFDIVLFVPVMLVALLLLDSVVSIPVATVPENVNASRYAYEGLSSTLGATVPLTQIWAWYPPAPWWISPCPNPGQGCWVQSFAQDWEVSSLIELDAYLVSCHANTVFGTVVTQAQLDTPGWMGSAISLTAQSVALGNQPGGTVPTTYSSYYFDFNSTSYGFGPGCTGPVTPMRAHDGSYPPYPTGEVYTWSLVLEPDDPGVGPVQVVMAFWGP